MLVHVAFRKIFLKVLWKKKHECTASCSLGLREDTKSMVLKKTHVNDIKLKITAISLFQTDFRVPCICIMNF